MSWYSGRRFITTLVLCGSFLLFALVAATHWTADTTTPTPTTTSLVDAEFIEVSDGPEFRTDLHQALRDGLTALGLLGWECKEGSPAGKMGRGRLTKNCYGA